MSNPWTFFRFDELSSYLPFSLLRKFLDISGESYPEDFLVKSCIPLAFQNYVKPRESHNWSDLYHVAHVRQKQANPAKWAVLMERDVNCRFINILRRHVCTETGNLIMSIFFCDQKYSLLTSLG